MLQCASPIPFPSPARVAPREDETGRMFAGIETSRARLYLIRAGRNAAWLGSYVYPFCGDDDGGASDGWLWEAVSAQGQSLGFIGLMPLRPIGAPQAIFGPMLTVMLKRDLAPALGSEIINGLMNWLDGHHVCHVVHASHTKADPQLGAWLDRAGFLYTGCRDDDGSRAMILVL